MKLQVALIFAFSLTLSAQEPSAPGPGTSGHKAKRSGDPGPPIILAASRTEKCGTSFFLPVGWQAQRAEASVGPTCSLGLLPPDWSAFVSGSEVEREGHPITVFVSAEGLERVASSAGFRIHEGAWYVGGRAGSETRARRIEGEGWHGFLGEPTVGVHFKSGGYAGLGDTQRALLMASDGRCAVLDASVIEYWPVFSRVLESFRFLTPVTAP